MTDKEKAEEYAKLNARQYIHNDGIGFCTSEEEVKQAFLAGLKAGRPEWHKPDDLPDNERYVWSNVGAGYHDDDGWWDDIGWELKVIAWCEPKFEED